MNDLSPLEWTILGVVHTLGPCTPYAIRKEFQDSPSSHWSGSAGAIYPAVARLKARGLVRSAPAPTGRRAALAYRLTAAGLAELRSWLRSPLEASDVSVPYDALRTRVFFLRALSPAERARFLTDALDAARRHLAAVETHEGLPARGREDALARIAGLGALCAARARVEWLERAVVALGRASPVRRGAARRRQASRSPRRSTREA